jgi:lysophospholipase L1-like esterase
MKYLQVGALGSALLTGAFFRRLLIPARGIKGSDARAVNRLPVWKKVLFSVCAILGVLCALELFADAVYVAHDLFVGPNTDDPFTNILGPLPYEFRPNNKHHFAGGATATANSLGLRGPELEEPKRRLRVLCIGDSCTHGYAPDVTDDRTYPALLGLWLDHQAPGQFEVINGGMPNFGTLDCLNFFLYKGIDVKPDYVVIMCGWNDIHHLHCLWRQGPDQGGSRSPFESSSLFRLGRAARARLGTARRSASAKEAVARLKQLPVGTDQFSELAFARTERILSCLVQSCRTHNAKPILMTYPSFARADWTDLDSLTEPELKLLEIGLTKWDFSPKGVHAFISRTNQIMVTVAGEHRVPLIRGESLNEPQYFADIIHPNAQGNEFLANLVGSRILQP